MTEPGPASVLPSAADLRAAAPEPGPSAPLDATVVPCRLRTEHWVEVCLLDENDEGIADQRCHVTAPDGRLHACKTDQQGLVRVDGLPSGTCQITFPDLDTEVWDFVRSVDPR